MMYNTSHIYILELQPKKLTLVVHIYIYIYIERERERELSKCMQVPKGVLVVGSWVQNDA
jgi:hypothetical protein